MSTSDRHEQGPLTRKQLREIRLTGATPVITPEEAAAAAAAQEPSPEVDRPSPAVEEPTPEPSDAAPAGGPQTSTSFGSGQAPLTRRQVRERERGNTAATAITDPAAADADSAGSAGEDAPVESSQAEDVSRENAAVEQDHGVDAQVDVHAQEDESSADAPVVERSDDEDDADDVQHDADAVPAPVSAAESADTAGEVPIVLEQVDDSGTRSGSDDALHSDGATETGADDTEHPTVSSTFGRGVLQDADVAPQPVASSFDELLTAGESTGSQHRSPSTLIFTPSPGEGSLSGPVASTGEILITGSYELPKGLGSRGHADGTTDGKDVDAVLIDGELPPASSPTPIAASAAVSTIKPAGEVIRPPAPEKGNKLMLTLAIVAGGLALALGVALIVAFTTNVF